MPTHNVTDVSITCSDQAYRLGGTIAGLSKTGLVLSDGSDTYPVSADATTFTLPTVVASGSNYRVSVQVQPAELTCTISNGEGTMPTGAVTTIDVTCASSSFTLGGSISGLTKSGLVLTDGADELSIAANAAQFSMPNALARSSNYAVTIRKQPTGEACQVSDGTGTMSGEVGTVRIACVAAEE
jgi:hypothetical protein